MGTCIPLEILGDRGFITNKQTSIESISLITGGACPINTDGENTIDLSAFRSLRHISWTGLQSSEEFDALSRALKNNSERLRELRLDFVNWSEEESFDSDASQNFFASQVLKLSADQCGVMFPALETLSLESHLPWECAKGDCRCCQFPPAVVFDITPLCWVRRVSD